MLGLADQIAERWAAEIGGTMPQVLHDAWRSFERKSLSAVPAEVRMIAASLIDTDDLSMPLAILDQLGRATRAGRAGVSAEALEAARVYVARNGHPTGVRFVRGSHSGDYIEDPLGLDSPMLAPWLSAHRPTLVDVAIELARVERGERAMPYALSGRIDHNPPTTEREDE